MTDDRGPREEEDFKVEALGPGAAPCLSLIPCVCCSCAITYAYRRLRSLLPPAHLSL